MAETAPKNKGITDPGIVAGNALVVPELHVRFSTFEEAQNSEKGFSDTFIDGCINGTLSVGDAKVGIRGYLDKVEATERDDAIIADQDAIAGLYTSTTKMIARNLKIHVASDADKVKSSERVGVIKKAKEQFIAKLRSDVNSAPDGIIDYCNGQNSRWPIAAIEYRGFDVDARDPLNALNKSASDFRSTIRVQRQVGGTFIMGYSDQRVKEKLTKQDRELAKRIYLNPDVEIVPEIFEQVLQTANQAGLSIQLKMLERASEFAYAHRQLADGEPKGGLRGDGIVVYAEDAQANEVLAMVIAIAKDKPEAFVGRKTSRIPIRIAEGIAVGDEPIQGNESLTAHRLKILEYAAGYVRKAGITGQEARNLFRRRAAVAAKANNVNPNNLAFNQVELLPN